MLTDQTSASLCDLIAEFARSHNLIPSGQQLYVHFELRPVPAVPDVIIQVQPSMALSYSIEDLGLSGRALKSLKNGGYNTVADLLKAVEDAQSPRPLLKLSNFGRESLMNLRNALQKLGFILTENWKE